MTRSLLDEAPITDLDKGAPGNGTVIPLADVGAAELHLLSEDMSLPVAVIKQRALEHNSAWMREFTALHGVSIAPHGKTSMAPQIFALQERDGAWGITLSTPHQIRIARTFGHRRIFVANQIVGKAGIEYVYRAQADDPDLELFCIVDSLANVQALSKYGAELGAKRPLRVLVELGLPHFRTGCRTIEQALAIARAVKQTPHVALAGVEGFEGLVMRLAEANRVQVASDFLNRIVEVARRCCAEDLFETPVVLLSAGGTAYVDLVSRILSGAHLEMPATVLIRSGCYITHDSKMYEDALNQFALREPDVIARLGRMQPAMEIWAYVQSRPEPTRVIAGLGKRDAAHDDLPIPLVWHRPNQSGAPSPVPPGHSVRGMNDQHAYLDVPEDSPLQVGDMVAFGVSHPCLTFDKWRLFYLVDDDYRATAAFRTYF